MKTTGIKMILGCMLFASFAMESFGQAPMTTTEEGGKKPIQLDKKKVPDVVTQAYVVDYPIAVSESWYGYPIIVDESDSYGANEYLLVTDQYPEYYIVEFTKDKTPHKAIYSKDGKKISSCKTVSTLPKEVLLAVNKGDYKGWTITKQQEEIYKDDKKAKVYKVVVEKGTEKHALFYQPDGTLLKDKKIRS